jgi:hypothetical protein
MLIKIYSAHTTSLVFCSTFKPTSQKCKNRVKYLTGEDLIKFISCGEKFKHIKFSTVAAGSALIISK